MLKDIFTSSSFNEVQITFTVDLIFTVVILLRHNSTRFPGTTDTSESNYNLMAHQITLKQNYLLA